MSEPNQYFGKDCPKGKVQIEFVGCPPSGRPDAIEHCALVTRSSEYRLGLHKARGVFEYEE